MQFPRLTSFARQSVSLALAAILVTPGWAQETSQPPTNAPSQAATAPAQSARSQAFQFSNYSKPRSHFPNQTPGSIDPQSSASLHTAQVKDR